ncbi:mitochondrial ribosomal protein S19 [Volvox carteri f. nagariensis]|uniref:Small ribosomal subunit protein uS19c n=1 Tax=Volvox carteri f. nagariensis TaxID=3068 RepID=D8U2V4_VOLCA|nr:mitochondrial ribosomal protein S19 [Volvox carteri f. nagariensis]EFJ45874.1 mitochondrial ribosomal protein S19 [Volvox carteri f. nagariensis]|eukprot:XP_002952952.1 mitochondrial ribosomal protein S19 [Volvox carteri f. nagariensis]
MPRSIWKGPYVAVSLLQDVVNLARKHPDWWNKGRFLGQKAPEVINTYSRASVILPDFLACRFGVHNGKSFTNLEVQEAMVGHRLGEFSPTKVIAKHKAKESTSVVKKKINPKTGKAG